MLEDTLRKSVALLSSPSPEEERITARGGRFPSVAALQEAMSLVRSIVFPDFFAARHDSPPVRSCHIGGCIGRLYAILKEELDRGFCFGPDRRPVPGRPTAAGLALDFIGALPEIKRLLFTDVEAMYHNDPAVDNMGEVILCYPVVQAMLHYRVAHALLRAGVPVIPRILTELAHSATGIDIHPGARIGEHFAIDHGTGVVIGETCIIGNHVTLYQGVTLGAKNFSLDHQGHPVNLPRHPIIEDNVTIYSNSSILGRITVGRDSVIGGNVWLTYSVPPGSRILQHKAVATTFTGGLGI